MKQRSFIKMIILTVITLGIYLIYWSCRIQGDLKKKTGEGLSVGGHLALTIITFGVYLIYWSYAVGCRLAKLGCDNLSLPYFIITLCGFGVITCLLIQRQVNEFETNLKKKVITEFVEERESIDHWCCEYCGKINSLKSYKCSSCGSARKVNQTNKN